MTTSFEGFILRIVWIPKQDELLIWLMENLCENIQYWHRTNSFFGSRALEFRMYTNTIGLFWCGRGFAMRWLKEGISIWILFLHPIRWYRSCDQPVACFTHTYNTSRALKFEMTCFVMKRCVYVLFTERRQKPHSTLEALLYISDWVCCGRVQNNPPNSSVIPEK